MLMDLTGSTKYVTIAGDSARQKALKKGKRFTTLPLISLYGYPVMCVMVIEGTFQSLFIESGIDVTKLGETVNIDNVTDNE